MRSTAATRSCCRATPCAGCRFRTPMRSSTTRSRCWRRSVRRTTSSRHWEEPKLTVTLEPTALAALADRLRAAGCVFAEDEAALLAAAAESADELSAMLSRRLDGVPVEQVVGWAEFCGL